MPLYIIPIQDLRAHVNPMDGTMWKCRPIQEKEVRDAIDAGKMECRSWGDVVNTLGEEDSRLFHINRIATLVTQPTEEKIIIVVENHQSPIRIYLNDGNHRLAAAYIRGDFQISALCACSAPERPITDVFPGAVLA